MIDTESDPGSWADAISHSPCLRVEDYVPRAKTAQREEDKS